MQVRANLTVAKRRGGVANPNTRRRKVKCNEKHPKCSHCERLNIECVWNTSRRDANAQIAFPSNQRPSPTAQGGNDTGMLSDWGLSASIFGNFSSFDYDYLTRDPSTQDWSQVASDGIPGLFVDSLDASNRESPSQQSQDIAGASNLDMAELPLPYSRADDETVPFQDDELMQFFIQSVRPPILEDVEASKKWLIIRHAMVDMARNASMVRDAISAFSALLIARKCNNDSLGDQRHYKNASDAVAAFDTVTMADYSHDRQHVLVALFFLCYIDILGVQMETAHLNLKRAYTVFQKGQKNSFSAIERQLLLWIRLLDGRAVSAGGEGMFLADNDAILTQSSPSHNEYAIASPEGSTANDDDSVEDALFQTLYQPGLDFFQKVQSFSGRISKIDPWHRARGTVEDEIEVVNIGVAISTGLRTLYSQRPILMDLAVAGKLTESHLSAHLASSISRTFRTYLSNFYAARVHLHRVAYKTLPLTKEAEDALRQIRTLAHQIVADLGQQDNLPVTMLWPLLMLGVEEAEAEERIWIREQILRMENVAGNARLTTKVLEEVQLRQDAANARVDIRSVQQSVFNSSFAIV
ncbi:C6 finger domain [Cordyceps militaris]|uniref:C6 finger domain n=1 Tax=Cordyceps militaris TaxID=73501 RepID=A0A2H4SE77_CORMI|nr:C6 finger domain [Cordyceps militaris]